VANPQHAKTPKLNALLIGKRTVPSGCKVLNVSQQGMSLQCDPDGRLLTFSSGDAVDIFLSVQHANGHNKFTIPAIVSHVDENLIDVVFHCTDTELAGLIESYRTSESHELDASIDHRLVSKTGSQAKPVAINEESVKRKGTAESTTRGRLSFYTGLLALFITSIVLLGAYNYIYSINKRLNSLEAISRTHTEELSEVQAQAFSSRLQDGRYASLNARIKTLTEAFQSFEARVSEALLQKTPATATAHQATVKKTAASEPEAAITEPVEQQPETIASESPAPEPSYITRVELERKPAPKITPTPKYVTTKEKTGKTSIADSSNLSTRKYPAIESETSAPTPATLTTPTETAKPVEAPISQSLTEVEPAIVPARSKVSEAATPETTNDKPRTIPAPTPIPVQVTTSSEPTSPGTQTGPWVINLLSSPSKAYVGRMQTAASQSGIDTTITSAEVKGKQYWRLQIAGFESMAAARRAAAPVKDSLDINDVWIFKRKR
jgi:hypothetical protein